MCGRYLLKALPRQVIDFFGLIELEDFPPRYNIAPTQPILVVLAGPPAEPGSNRPVRYAQLARWGFLPSWLKDTQGFPLLINARSETAAEKNTFRGAMRHRRALVPASGFYEWKRDKGGKGKSQAYWVRPTDGGIVAFAALMETWQGPDGSEIDTVAILTTAANGEFAAIHDRMPVTIAPEEFDRWLDCRNYEPREVADLLAPPPEGLFEAVAISDRVNKVANADPDILEPVEERAKPDAAPQVAKKDDQLDLSDLAAPAVSGFALGASLIIAIGAQNAFILRQGLLRAHVFVLCLICALSDAVLIAAGVAGLGTLVSQTPGLIKTVTLGGAAFLFAYAALALRRAFHPGALTAARSGERDLRKAVAVCLAFTFLNPHVYLDTVVLVGSLSARHAGTARLAFAAGAVVASFAWFFALGYGARLLQPLFAKPAAWRVLDLVIAAVMAMLAVNLLAGL